LHEAESPSGRVRREGNDDGGLTPFGQKWEATLIVAAILLMFALPFLVG
jgi:hypothetical protein